MTFAESCDQLSLLVQSLRLKILIWGPGEAAPDFPKRETIRNKVREHFPNAEVRYSEDHDLNQLVPGFADVSLQEREHWQLAACDACIVLDTSKGAGEEIAHFVGSPYSHKLIIFTHEKYQQVTSFAAALRENQNQMFYNDEEYDSCCALAQRILGLLMHRGLAKLGGLMV